MDKQETEFMQWLEEHPGLRMWANDNDLRAAFEAGYQRGYNAAITDVAEGG